MDLLSSFTNGIAGMLTDPAAPIVTIPNALVINCTYKHSTETTSNISEYLLYPEFVSYEFQNTSHKYCYTYSPCFIPLLLSL
jgi:hypothetical protein